MIEECYAPDAGLSIIKTLVKRDRSLLRLVNADQDTPFETALLHHHQHGPVIEFLQFKLSFDELVAAERNTTRVGPVMEAQCESLLDVLSRDVAGIVFEYIGLTSLRQQRQLEFQQQQCKRAKLN